MPHITIAEINPAALKRYQDISAESPDGPCLLWDSHRMLRMGSATTPGTLIEHATVLVAGVGNNDLDPIRDAIRAAGGERGLVP